MKRYLAGSLALPGVLLVAGYALGEDVGRVTPGSMCQKLSGGTLVATNEGSIYNSSASDDLEVLCPLVRPDHVRSVADARVIVHGGNHAEKVECTVRCRNHLSNSFNSSTKISRSDERIAFEAFLSPKGTEWPSDESH